MTLFIVISMTARRAIAWPLIWLGMLLTEIAKWLIIAGAWLVDRDDVYEGIE